jgi:hypothetical protein
MKVKIPFSYAEINEIAEVDVPSDMTLEQLLYNDQFRVVREASFDKHGLDVDLLQKVEFLPAIKQPETTTVAAWLRLHGRLVYTPLDDLSEKLLWKRAQSAAKSEAEYLVLAEKIAAISVGGRTESGASKKGTNGSIDAMKKTIEELKPLVEQVKELQAKASAVDDLREEVSELQAKVSTLKGQVNFMIVCNKPRRDVVRRVMIELYESKMISKYNHLIPADLNLVDSIDYLRRTTALCREEQMALQTCIALPGTLSDSAHPATSVEMADIALLSGKNRQTWVHMYQVIHDGQLPELEKDIGLQFDDYGNSSENQLQAIQAK